MLHFVCKSNIHLNLLLFKSENIILTHVPVICEVWAQDKWRFLTTSSFHILKNSLCRFLSCTISRVNYLKFVWLGDDDCLIRRHKWLLLSMQSSCSFQGTMITTTHNDKYWDKMSGYWVPASLVEAYPPVGLNHR